MNKQQHNRLEEIINELTELVEEEQDKFDNAPENLQGSELFIRIEDNISTLEEAIDTLDNIEN